MEHIFTPLISHMRLNLLRICMGIKKHLPDTRHLPSSIAGKIAVIALGLVGLGTLVIQQADAAVSISTSLTNNVMTIQQLRVTDNGLVSGPAKVDLDNNGIKLYIGAATGVLKRNVAGYITQGPVYGADIGNGEISGTKLQDGSITTIKIADGAITNNTIANSAISCDKLSIPGFTCTSSTAPSGSCPSGQFLQGINADGSMSCAMITTGGTLPTCDSGQILVFRDNMWKCDTPLDAASGTSLWTLNTHVRSNPQPIYNNNLSGKVGVDTMVPSATLTVSGTFLVEENLPVLYVGNGKVGVLNDNPQYALDVSGTIHATQFFTTSDERVKTDIKPLTDSLKGILSVNGYSYILTSDGSHQYGVLAQEIENVFPYLVSTDSNGFKAVNYNGLIAPIIQSLHELNTKVETLESLSSSNAARLDALEKKIH